MAQQTEEKDSDKDGMPDQWELKHDCDPVDPVDAALDYDLDGFSNIDECKNGTDPGTDIVGHKALGRMQPLWQWSPDEVLEELDRSAAIPWDRFFTVRNYYSAFAGKANKRALEQALSHAYEEGMKVFVNEERLPKGFLAAIRQRGMQKDHGLDSSMLLVSTNFLVQQVALASLNDDELADADVQSIIQHFDKLESKLKVFALSLLTKKMSPDVKTFLGKIEDPSMTNRARVVLQEWEKRGKDGEQGVRHQNTK